MSSPRINGKRRQRPPLGPKDVESESLIDTIYRDPADGKGEGLRTIEQSKTRTLSKKLFVILGISGLIVASTLAGFFTFNRTQRFNEKGVNVTTAMPGTVSSAGEATYSFVVTNDESTGIRNVELSLSTPDGWSFKTSDVKPSDTNNSLWQLGEIPAHAKRTLIVTGALTGEIGSVKTFNVSVTFRPNNFNYDFTKKASGSVTIGTSIITLDVKGPAQTAAQSAVRYVVTYANTSGETLRGLRLTATFPDGFTVKSSDPKPREGTNVWMINELKSGTEGTVTIDGTVGGNAGDTQQLTVVADLKQGSQYERQVETSFLVLIVASTVDLKVTVNGNDGQTVASGPGESLAFEVGYSNTSDLEMKNAVVTVECSGGAYDAATFTDDYGSSVKDGSVSWDVKKVPDLASLKPGSTGTIRFSLKISDSPKVTKGETGSSLIVKAALTADDGSENGKSVKITAPTLTVRISSVVTFAVDPRFYAVDGSSVGSGPLPPVVGKATTYRVVWSIKNSGNELKDMIVSAAVPAAVFWTGKNISVTAGDLAFDTTNRTVTWTLNRLPATAGQDGAPLTANFEVTVTPGSNDVGTFMTLIDASTLRATDSFSGAVVGLARDRVTTDLPNDTKASGKGMVVAL